MGGHGGSEEESEKGMLVFSNTSCYDALYFCERVTELRLRSNHHSVCLSVCQYISVKDMIFGLPTFLKRMIFWESGKNLN